MESRFFGPVFFQSGFKHVFKAKGTIKPQKCTTMDPLMWGSGVGPGHILVVLHLANENPQRSKILGYMVWVNTYVAHIRVFWGG